MGQLSTQKDISSVCVMISICISLPSYSGAYSVGYRRLPPGDDCNFAADKSRVMPDDVLHFRPPP